MNPYKLIMYKYLLCNDNLTMYWVNTKKFCGAIAIDKHGNVDGSETAPCYKWMTGKKFSKMLSMLKYKKYLIGCKKLM